MISVIVVSLYLVMYVQHMLARSDHYLLWNRNYIWMNEDIKGMRGGKKKERDWHRVSYTLQQSSCKTRTYPFYLLRHINRSKNCWMRWAILEYLWVLFQRLQKCSSFIRLTEWSSVTDGCGEPQAYNQSFLIWLTHLRKGVSQAVLWPHLLIINVYCMT